MRISERRLRRVIRGIIREGLHVDSHIRDLLGHRKDWRDYQGFWKKGAQIKVYKLGQELYKILQNSSLKDQNPELIERVKDMNWLAPCIKEEVEERIGSGQHRNSIQCIDVRGDNTGYIQGSDEHINCAIEVCIELYQDSISNGTMWKDMCEKS